MNTATEEIKRLAELMRSSVTSHAYNAFFDYETAAKAILEHYLPSPSVVSPLVWEVDILDEQQVYAKTPIGTVRISKAHGGYVYNIIVGRCILDRKDLIVSTLEEAKSEAENYYQSLVGSCLQGGGYMEEQMKDLIQYMYKRITKTTLAPFNIEDYFNDYLSSLKQQ